MKDSLLKAALDIGSSKVRLVLGELSENGQKIRIVDTVELPAIGMKKALVEDAESLSLSVKKALEIIEKKNGHRIEKVSIGVGGKHVKSSTKDVKFTFPQGDKVIEEKDLDNLYRVSQEEMVGPEEKIMKKEVYNIRVDNSGILKHPVGMTGSFIEGDVHLITAEVSHMESLVEVVNKAGVEVDSVTLNAYASAQSVLTPEDKKIGTALVDIGEGSTDLAIFKSDKLIYAKSIPVGGLHYTNDISYILQVEKRDAEKLRDLCQSKRREETITIDIDGEEKNFAVSTIKDIIDARSEDIVRYVAKAVEESGFKGYLGNGIILTGGVAMFEGVVEKLAKDLNYRVRLGMPLKIKGMTEVDSSMSTSLGILLETFEREHERIKNHEKFPDEDNLEEQTDENSLKIKGASETKSPQGEKNKEEKKGKKKVFNLKGFSLKEWLSNFI